MADQTEIIIKRRRRSKKTGAIIQLYYRAPDGVTAQQAQSYTDAMIARLDPFLGDPATLSTSCGIVVVPPPVVDAPQWRSDFAPISMEAGAGYAFTIAASDIINLPAGVTIVAFAKTGGSLPYLVVPENKLPTELFGSVPAGATAGTVLLTAKLSSGVNVTKEFTLSVKAAVSLYGAVNLSSNNLIVRIGGDSASDTRIQLISGPAGYGYADTYVMNHSTTGDQIDLIGKRTFYTQAYPSPKAGRYVFKAIQAAQAAYFAVTYDPAKGSIDVAITFTPDVPVAGDELGDIMWTINPDRTATASVTASKDVEITPPRLSTASATAYVNMVASGSSYGYMSGVLPGSDTKYVGTYRLKGASGSMPYEFTIPKTTVVAVDRIDTDNGQTTELLAKASFADGLQYRLATYLDDGTLGDFSDWSAMGSTTDIRGYQYTVLGGYQSGKLYKKQHQFRAATNPSVVVSIDVPQVASNQARRTIYPAGTAPASNDGNLSETFTYSTAN